MKCTYSFMRYIHQTSVYIFSQNLQGIVYIHVWHVKRNSSNLVFITLRYLSIRDIFFVESLTSTNVPAFTGKGNYDSSAYSDLTLIKHFLENYIKKKKNYTPSGQSRCIAQQFSDIISILL